MESSAFIDLCKQTGVTPLAIVKGVSDLGVDKTDYYYRKALSGATDGIRDYLDYNSHRFEEALENGKLSVV